MRIPTMLLCVLIVSPVLPTVACAASVAEPEVLSDTTVRWQGRTLHVIDEEGVFVTPADPSSGDVPLPPPNRPVGQIIEKRGWAAPVTCRLIDYVDCSKKTHDFNEQSKGGPTRVIEIQGREFRVTGLPPKDDEGNFDRWTPPFFEYTVKTADQAGTPHLIVYELPNDRERYTTVSLTLPDGIGKGIPFSEPYAGQEKVKVDAFSISQEPFWYEPDVGLCTYTGRDLEIDNTLFRGHLVFFSKAARMSVRISSTSVAKEIDERSGAAVSRIWVFEILDDLADRFPEIEPPRKGDERRMGVYTTHPWYYLAHYGAPPHTPQQRRDSLERLCDLLAFCGMNLIEFNAINGSDRAGAAWYPSPTGYYNQLGADLLQELPPVAAERGIEIVPVVTSITAPQPIEEGQANEHGFSEMSFQVHYDPEVDPRSFSNRAPDPLRLETQRWLIRHVREIAVQSRHHENVTGIGFRVNGKIGTCYISGENASNKGDRVRSASEMGYSRWNLQEFRRETGLPVPQDSMEAYPWLRADPKRWENWLDFRCRRTREFWLRVRDAVQGVRSDWTLYVLTDLPAEVPDTNVKWPGPGAPDAEAVTLELLRAHGFDPRMYTEDEGILIQRVMMIDADRIHSTRWGPPWGSNPTRYRDFHEQEFLPDWYRTPAGSATELYHAYWEEPRHPDIWEFGPDGGGTGMRTATATAKGRAFYRGATFTLRAGNTDTIVLNGWERPVLGHEHDLRRFCQAVRALPVAEAKTLRTSPSDPKVKAAWYGRRIGVINDSPEPRTVTVRLDKPLDANERLRDVATGQVLIEPDADDRGTFKIDMLDYDVRTLVIE